MRVFFDSSAFAKRYVSERGTDDVLAWCDRASELAVSVILIPEVVSTLRRLVREGRLGHDAYLGMKTDLAADLADAMLCDTSPQVLQRAVDVLEAHPLRAMDSLHVAAAIVCGADVFISADVRQCAAAKHLGLEVVAL